MISQKKLNEQIIDTAFLRLESLWDSWLETRFHNRDVVTTSLVLNIKLIISFGNEESFSLLLNYVEGFEVIIKKSIIKEAPEVGELIFPFDQ